MTICNYIYDTDGLRWEDGNVLVELAVDGKHQIFSVVRNGQGRSRLERFADRAHRLDNDERKIFGEITTTDLARICENGELKIGGLTASSGLVTNLTLTYMPEGRGVPRCEAVAVTEHGEFAVTLEPRRCAGTSGRTDDYSRLSWAFDRRPADQRQALALAQLTTMPKSGRAGGPAARSRLLVVVERVSNVTFLEAAKNNPDILLHLTPVSFGVLRERHDEAEVRALAALVERARNDDPHYQPSNVVLLLNDLGDSRHGAIVGDDGVLSRIAEEVKFHRGSSYALELLVRDGSATQLWDLLEDAAGTVPARVYTFELVSMLTRVNNDNARSLLDKIALAHAETLADQPLTMHALPDGTRALVIAKAPLRALETAELTGSEVAQACAALAAQVAASDVDQAELIRRITVLPVDVRTKVLTSLGSETAGDAVVAGTRRVEAQQRARLRGTVRELQRLADAARKDVSVLGDRLRGVGESCLDQARNAPLVMLSVRHGGLPDPANAARFERNRRVLEETIAERRVNIAKRIEDLRAAVTLLDGHVEDAQKLAGIREAVMSLRAWYRRQEENLDAIRYPRSEAESARLSAVGRELVEVGGRMPAELAVRVEDLSTMLETLIER